MRLFSSRRSSSRGASDDVESGAATGVRSSSRVGGGGVASSNVLLGGRRGLIGGNSKQQRAGTGGVARKVDEAPSRPSGSPLKNTESAFTRIARRLSFSSSAIASGKRRSLTGQRAPLSIKDAAGQQQMAVANEVTMKVATPQAEVPPLPKEVAIPCKIVTEAELEEEKAKLVKDLGADTAEIVRRVAAEFSPKQSDVVDVSTMSHTTMKFCGRSAPPVSLALYLSRLIRNINNALDEGVENHVDSVGVRCLLIAVIYIQRMKVKQPEFEINALNVHRLFFVAMTDALKVNEDEHPDNKYMALVGGVDTTQLNTLEAAFCTSSDFNFIVTMDQLERTYRLYHKKTHTLVAPANHEKYPVRRVSWESKA